MDIRLLTRCSVVKEPLSAGSAVQLSNWRIGSGWVRTRHQRSTCRTASRLTIAGPADLESVEVRSGRRILRALKPDPVPLPSRSDSLRVWLAPPEPGTTRTWFTIDIRLVEQARKPNINVSAAAREGVRRAVGTAQICSDRDSYRRMPERADPFSDEAEAWGDG